MRILALESSCDESAVAVYDDARGLLAHEIYSQVDLHRLYGGVVPELASRDHVRRLLPLTRSALAAAGINRVLDGVAGEKAVHLCYGNYGGQTIQQGTYQKLIAFLNELHADHVVLEMARRPPEELAMLRDVRPTLGLGIGVIDIKDNEVESADRVARRIDNAVKLLDAERIRWVHPDCGFWMLQRSVADRKMQALVAGRDLFTGA